MSIKKKIFTMFGKYNEKGEEIMDPTPIAIPASYRRPPTLQEQMARYMRSAQEMARLNEAESFEEADDFDIGEDYDPDSPHELVYDQELGREMSKDVKRDLDRERSQFDEHIRNKKLKARNKKFDEEKPLKKPSKKEKLFEEEED